MNRKIRKVGRNVKRNVRRKVMRKMRRKVVSLGDEVVRLGDGKVGRQEGRKKGRREGGEVETGREVGEAKVLGPLALHLHPELV